MRHFHSRRLTSRSHQVFFLSFNRFQTREKGLSPFEMILRGDVEHECAHACARGGMLSALPDLFS